MCLSALTSLNNAILPVGLGFVVIAILLLGSFLASMLKKQL